MNSLIGLRGPQLLALAIGGLSGPEMLVLFGLYFGAIAAAVFFLLRALWRIGDGLFSISRAIASRQQGKDSD